MLFYFIFQVSVVGEFNSGKSAFVNSLLGGQFVQEGILPTTDYITKVTYSDHESCMRNSALNMMEVKIPVPWLKEVNIVDTPGTNALFELGHQAITERFLPNSDLVLFVTSAERPLSESERQIIRKIHEWDRKVVVLVNKCDLFHSEEEQQEVLEYVRTNLEDIIPGNNMPIFPLSARLAMIAKLNSARGEEWEELWTASNIGAVEDYMFNLLDDEQKFRYPTTCTHT
jgi:small GTP-binding protein